MRQVQERRWCLLVVTDTKRRRALRRKSITDKAEGRDTLLIYKGEPHNAGSKVYGRNYPKNPVYLWPVKFYCYFLQQNRINKKPQAKTYLHSSPITCPMQVKCHPALSYTVYLETIGPFLPGCMITASCTHGIISNSHCSKCWWEVTAWFVFYENICTGVLLNQGPVGARLQKRMVSVKHLKFFFAETSV